VISHPIVQGTLCGNRRDAYQGGSVFGLIWSVGATGVAL
jgi:hypothetical protein